MATTTNDDTFREIQLNGKQLFFLFMAVVVVSVVIFLCGVLVGRGVRAEVVPIQAMAAPAPAGAVADAVAPAPPSGNTPRTANEDLSYPNRLANREAPVEKLRAPDAPARTAAPATATRARDAERRDAERRDAEPAIVAPAPTAPVSAGPAGGNEPGGAGFAIQVAALRQRAEADSVVRGLTSKGYPAYVMTPDTGAPAVFRVRVGKFKDRQDAETVAARLQKEEQFKPWIVR
jgi:cell division septation protein DedD